jgi:imidazolonepropionase-like amidohydrolase
MTNRILRRSFLILAFFSLGSYKVLAQFQLPQARLSDERNNEFILKNATLISEPGQKIDSAFLHIRDGKIVASGKVSLAPKGIFSIDLSGAWIYPSFIDLFSTYGMPAIPAATQASSKPQYERTSPGALASNQTLRPELDASTLFQPLPKDAEELRKLGFGMAAVCPKDGLMRGKACLVSLGNGSPSDELVKSNLYQSLSFQKGSSSQVYPSSQMGAIALLRQTFLDASWYAKALEKSPNLSLETLANSQNALFLFETHQKFEVLRAASLAKEFSLKAILKGGGDEYQRITEIRKTGFPLVIPLQFPELPDVEDPLDAQLISLPQLKHWELAPANAAILAKEGLPFAFSLSDLKDIKTFFSQIRKATEHGLSEADALKALSTNPASFLGISETAGKLKPGFLANFFIASGNIFQSGNSVLSHYIKGKKYPVITESSSKLSGNYRLQLGSDTGRILKIFTKEGKKEISIQASKGDTTLVPATTQWESGRISFSCSFKDLNPSVRYQFTGWETPEGYAGWYSGESASNQSWSATYLQPGKTTPLALPTPISLGEIWFPFQAYGTTKTGNQNKSALFRNGTLWTNEAEGIITETDILVLNGKIEAIGTNLKPPSGIPVFDVKGKHVTSGIIDEHSHIAISKGVNEGSSTTSSEVRIGDVIDADDVNIYRHLSGGVTAVQQLHGSANTIGGQSSLIKLRWGKSPEDLKIQGAPGFIKFALGENVKQSNWGDQNTIRYPQTRMGVEQLLYDAFSAAKKYKENQKNASKNPKIPFRRDLKLDALAEILEGKRFISCHSYVQSEINMLMHVADSMGFKVNTFTHILEGYKVADKMKKHGAGASTFSDWWAYKMEVKDAIPFNAALMQQHGLVVAINSDDAEMATRLNQEAAKTVKYGGLKETEAWKTVTLNPARLLHLDDKMGSLKIGKDADLVVWSGNPLKADSKAEKTFVDGELLFDISAQEALLKTMEEERRRILQKMLKAKQSGVPSVPIQVKTPHLWHCDDLGEE